MPPRTLRPGQTCQVWVGGVDVATPELVLETDAVLLEAPNWTLDGRALVLNGAGGLWTLDPGSPDASPVPVDLPGLPDLNNDHVLAPDGVHVYVSTADTHVYRVPLSGGPGVRVTPEDGRWHFLHGVSPDGARLAYVEIADLTAPHGRLVVLDADGTTHPVDVGPGHLDGPEWSPDGRWIHLNTEAFTGPGHAQLARVPDGGGPLERLLESDRVDWFPHLSPDGEHATYVSFPAGTTGHPADLEVEVRVVATTDWSVPLRSYPLTGGQGTINVNSWSPDSRRFAFVAYPIGP
ncbi:hypothetical protein GCM10022197_37950 [Microlunatus spumicola]|uniref:Biopolymer transporter Tol n=1 Tax=Microlunatus spumicola TaxID=81499 RepID=A0ABP6Y406_9ACTN